MPAGQSEIGVFQPLRRGVGDGVELSTYPLLNLLMPNLGLKAVWLTDGCLTLSGRHRLTYPSGLYTALAREGTGGIIPHETRVPHIIGLNNEILGTWAPHHALWVTPKIGVMLAARIGASTLPSIDLPVVYPRTAAYRKGWSANAGLDVDGQIWGPLWFSADADVFLLSTTKGRYAFEHSGLFIWQATASMRVMLGYKVVYGAYPFGTAFNLRNAWWPLPLFDVQWSLG